MSGHQLVKDVISAVVDGKLLYLQFLAAILSRHIQVFERQAGVDIFRIKCSQQDPHVTASGTVRL